MKENLDYELIDYYVELMSDKFESDFIENGDKEEYDKRKLWLKQYIKYLDYYRHYKISDYSRKSAVRAGLINHNKFNPITWVWGQKGNESRRYMKLYQQHFLMMAHIPLKNVDYNNYIIFDTRPKKPKLTIFNRMRNYLENKKEAIKCKVKK